MIAQTECKIEIGLENGAEPPHAVTRSRSKPDSPDICPAPTSPGRVLLVEDHNDTRTVIERFLKRTGLDVLAAGDLKTALNFVEAEHFDVIISDIALPDGTGYALISEARRRGIRALGI